MQIFNYFLFVCFINVCNSFGFFNNIIRSNLISLDCRHKLYMGCDYYIDKNLHLYDYNDTEFSWINVEKERGYYLFSSLLDEDEDGYDTQLALYIENILQPKMKPIVIYSNNTFNKLSSENKYKKIIEDDLQFFNKTLNDVSKIIKIENRYERW